MAPKGNDLNRLCVYCINNLKKIPLVPANKFPWEHGPNRANKLVKKTCCKFSNLGSENEELQAQNTTIFLLCFLSNSDTVATYTLETDRSSGRTSRLRQKNLLGV